MPEYLKTLVLSIIHDIYPKIEDDIILLSGSRALGVAQDNSDIDILIFTTHQKYEIYRNISIEKGYRIDGEDPGFEINIQYQNQKLCLEVKFMDKLSISSLIDYFSFTTTLCLNIDQTKDSELKGEMKLRFNNNYEKNLMKLYIAFFQDFKELKGLFEKGTSTIRDQSIFIKKGIVLEGLLKLLYIIQGQGHPTVKWLLYFLEGQIGIWHRLW